MAESRGKMIAKWSQDSMTKRKKKKSKGMWASTNNRCPDICFPGTGFSPWHILVANPERMYSPTPGNTIHIVFTQVKWATQWPLCILFALSQESWISPRHQPGKQSSRTGSIPMHLLNNLPLHVHFYISIISISRWNIHGCVLPGARADKCGLITVHLWCNCISYSSGTFDASVWIKFYLRRML